METVLVAGANGKTGKEIIGILQDLSNYKPLAMIRKEEQKATFEMMDCETVLADLEGDLREAVKGVDCVIFAAGSGGNTSEQKTKDVDQEGCINLIDRSKAANVKKFVMLSSMGTDSPTSIPELEVYLEAKKNAEDHLRASFLEYSIVKPGQLTDGEKTNKIKAKEKLNEHGKISRKDVAQVLVDCLSHNICKNKTFEILNDGMAIELALKELDQG